MSMNYIYNRNYIYNFYFDTFLWSLKKFYEGL